MIDRRAFLKAGGIGLASASLAAADLRDRTGYRAAKSIQSCILIFYYGGPSHIDLWDMKPDAPKEIRGKFKPIATKTPGITISELLPHSARVMDKLAIVRGLHHPMTNHNAAAFATLSGRNPAKGDLELLSNDRNDPPCLGSVLSHALAPRPGLPTFAALPHVMYNVVKLPGQVAGFLGSAYDPFQVSADPSNPAFRLDELDLPTDVPPQRVDMRRDLLQEIDQGTRQEPLDVYRRQALELVHSDATRRAARLELEDPRMRDRYGANKHGQSVLLARRLVEAGVRFVAVYDHQTNGQLANWDAHSDVFPRLQNDLVPPADRAFATLVEDLDARGLLDSTLVIAMGEFGRTPRINASAGRDHWPYCFHAVMAGGGIQGGVIHGASDKLGAYPDRDPTTPADLAATLLWRFGLEPSAEIQDLANRPYRMAEGRVLSHWF